MDSPLSNRDLAPTSLSQRNWTTWHIAALWIGMAVCIPTYTLAAGMIDQGMSWKQATFTVALGNLIVLIPMILNGHAGAKYGIPFPVLMRASFGTRGANLPAILRALVACGWFGIQTWIGGMSIYQCLGAMGVIDMAKDQTALIGSLGISGWQLACFMAFWAINVYFIWTGIKAIKWLETLAAPILIAAGLGLLVWMVRKVGSIDALYSQGSNFKPGTSFWSVFVPQLTAMVGFWATLSLNIPDFTRYANDQKSQALGQALGLPTTMTLFCFIGIWVTQGTVLVFGKAIWDPVELIAKIGSTPVIILSLFILSIATLTTNIAANVVSPANDISNLWPRAISVRTGGIITAIVGIAIMPWKLCTELQAYIFTWLIGYSALLGPIAGIMLCDYYVLRRRSLNVQALYQSGGEYSYGRGGVNWLAVLVLAVAVVPNLPGFINAATKKAYFPAFFDEIYVYAWFSGVAIAFVLYALVMKNRARPGASADPVE